MDAPMTKEEQKGDTYRVISNPNDGVGVAISREQ